MNALTDPIFIGGLDRSGKTLLRLALSLHPRIFITRRSDLWRYFYNRYGDLSQGENFERCLQAILKYKHVRPLHPNAERIRQEFWQGEPTYARLFALIHQHHAEAIGKPRWGDQSEALEEYAEEIFTAYPQARFIHLIRDPRDRLATSKSHWRHGRGKVGNSLGRWLRSTALAERYLRLYPDRYRVIRYEDLVSQPEAVLADLCEFLGEEYTPAMLKIGHLRHAEESNINLPKEPCPGCGDFLTDFIGLYLQRLSRNEIAQIQLLAKAEMQRWGYWQEKIAFTPKDLGEFILEFPLTLAHLGGWRVWEILRRASPAQFGHRPSGEKTKHLLDLKA
jgi:hypothetical protein